LPPLKTSWIDVWGPRMHIDDCCVISNFIVQALRGAPISIYGDGRQTRAFCYVDDLIEGFVRLMNTSDEVTGPVNLENPTEISIRELANKIIELTGSRSPILTKPLPEDDPLQRCPDISLATRLLGWKPTIALEEGLQRCIAYFDQVLRASA
jgi:UDP-glucuronate decarboxylase